MDVEPLVRMMRGDAVLHGMSHTIVGAMVLALIAAAVGFPVCNGALRILGLRGDPIVWRVVLVSALVGTFSHIALDAVMHGDMNPLWPITSGNGLLHFISVKMLHALCIVGGLLGGSFAILRVLRNP